MTQLATEAGAWLNTEGGGPLQVDVYVPPSVPTLLQAVGVTDVGFTPGPAITTPGLGALTAGSKLLAFAIVSTNIAFTFSDTTGNTWTTLTPRYWSNVGFNIAIGWADNPAGAASGETVTATYATSGMLRGIAVAEFVGLAAGGPEATTLGANSTTDPAQDALLTTLTPNALVLTAAAGDQPMTGPGAGYTALGSAGPNTGAWWEYLVKTAAGAVTPTMDQAGATQTEIISAAFAAA